MGGGWVAIAADVAGVGAQPKRRTRLGSGGRCPDKADGLASGAKTKRKGRARLFELRLQLCERWGVVRTWARGWGAVAGTHPGR